MKKVIQKTEFDIKPFTQVLIGDPIYLDSEKENPDLYARLIARFNINTFMKYAKVRVERYSDTIQYDGKDLDYTSIEVTIACAPIKRLINLYMQGRCYTGTVDKEWELGCDTAQYEANFITDGECKSITIHTGADGYYGDATTFSDAGKDRGALIHLSFYDDMFDFDEVVDIIKSLFVVTEGAD